MYLWNTSKIVNAIRENSITKTEFKNYYMVLSIITLISFYFATIEAASDLSALAIEAFVMILITALGINLAFKASGGEEGENFIRNFVVLSLPLMIKIIVISSVFGLIVGIFIYEKYSEVNMSLMLSIFGVLVQIWFYWRMCIHLSSIRS